MFQLAFLILQTAVGAPYTGEYVEIFQGPIVASGDIIGRGGTAIGAAEGAGATPFNPAAVANRYAHNGNQWYDWDFSFNYMYASGQVDNLEPSDVHAQQTQAPILGYAAVVFNFGKFGFGLSASFQNYFLCSVAATPCSSADSIGSGAVTGRLQVGYNLMDGALVVGAGFVMPNVYFTFAPDTAHAGLTLSSFLPQIGAVLRPTDARWRVGFSASLGSTLHAAKPIVASTPIMVPRGGHVPWEVGAGVQLSLSGRALNTRPAFQDGPAEYRAPVENWSDDWKLALDVVCTGGGSGAVSLLSWAAQNGHPVGNLPTVSVRGGVEGEFWPRRMRGRLGSYFEPARADGVVGRVHGTAGLDFHVGEFIWDWRVYSAVDAAKDYLNWGISVGIWH